MDFSWRARNTRQGTAWSITWWGLLNQLLILAHLGGERIQTGDGKAGRKEETPESQGEAGNLERDENANLLNSGSCKTVPFLVTVSGFHGSANLLENLLVKTIYLEISSIGATWL